MTLFIHLGTPPHYSPIASCEVQDLLSTLRGREVWRGIQDAMTKISILSESGAILASIIYDASIAHEEGEDWQTLSAILADKAGEAIHS